MRRVNEKLRQANDNSEEAPTLDELAREGARRMLETALVAEVSSYIETNQVRDEKGHMRL